MSTLAPDKNGGRYSCYDSFNINKDGVIGSEKEELPDGVKELTQECFAPGASGFFERRSVLPLLISTNLSILKRLKARNKLPNQTIEAESKSTGLPKRTGSNSIGTDFYGSADVSIIRACWEVILSFMGDESEPLEKGQCTGLFESTISQRRQNLSGKKIWKKPVGNTEVMMRHKVNSKRPKSMFLPSDMNGNDCTHTPKSLNSALSNMSIAHMTVLEKVHYITGVGLENPDFRDEIYCQILKQLVGNPTSRSSALGWILLSLVIGCFPPSNLIRSHVEKFLDKRRTSSSCYCLEKLKRTLANGERKNPPCSLELQAAKSRQLIRIPVICMDQSVRTIWSDSATLAAEMCVKMASKNRLEDTFGFSLYLALDKKLVPLGNRTFHVMDAVSQAERFSKLNDVQEIWRLYYRREYFSPLCACSVSNTQMDVWLTFSQICGGVRSGEYFCQNPQDLSLMIAHQYCVRHGFDKIDMKRVVAVCDQTLPSSEFINGKKKKWCRMVLSTLKALAAESRSTEKEDAYDVMKQVNRYGSKAFIANFTKKFHLSRFEEVNENENHTVMSAEMKINHQDIVVSRPNSNANLPDDVTGDHTLLELKVAELQAIDDVHQSSEKNCVSFTTTDGKKYKVESVQQEEIYEILERYLKDVTAMTSG